MCCDPHWSAYFSALTPLVVAAIAGWIAYRQMQTARDKLKLDLFDRRMAVYEAVRDAIGAAVTNAKLTQQQEFDFLMGTRSARWLFGEDVAEYINKNFWKKLTELNLHVAMSDSDDSSERAAHAKGRSEVLQWMTSQYKEFDELCAKYLTLKH